MTAATPTAAAPAPTSAPLAATIETLRQLSGDPSIWDSLPSSDGPAPYLPWHTVTRILDAGAPGWECETVGIHETPETITVTVKLSIGGAGRCASYQQAKTGKRRDGVIFQVAAPLEKAERRALARAAGLFGLGAEAPERGHVRRGSRPAPERRQPRSEPDRAEVATGDAPPLCGSCGQKRVGRKRDGSFFAECLDCGRKGGSEPDRPARPRRPAEGNGDTLDLIDRLPGNAGEFTGFLRRMQGAGAAEAERRYLWDLAKWRGLDFDQAGGEFVQAAS